MVTSSPWKPFSSSDPLGGQEEGGGGGKAGPLAAGL